MTSKPPPVQEPANTGPTSDPYGLGVYGTGYVRGAKPVVGYAGHTKGDVPLTGNQTYEYFQQLAAQNQQAFATLQRQMWQAGLYGGNYIPTFGVVTDKDRNAFKNVIRSVVGGKYQLPDFLNQVEQAGLAAAAMADAMAKAARAASRAPLVVRTTDPTTIKQIIDATAPNVLGRNLTDDEKNRLVDAYHGVESSFQRTAYSEANGSGGTAQEPPQVDAFVQEQAKQLHPEEADTYKKFTLGNQVVQLLGLNKGAGV